MTAGRPDGRDRSPVMRDGMRAGGDGVSFGGTAGDDERAGTRASTGPGMPGEEPEPAAISPHEQVMLAQAVAPVASRGVGATITIVLVVAAFVLGLVRPWDWLPATPAPAASGATVAGGLTAGASANAGVASPSPAPGSDAAAAQTCAYPQSWRSATIQRWAGRQARVWTAVEVVSAAGPNDATIPFQVVAGDEFTAIGWCAPVLGDARPPLDARARLFRIEAGQAVEVPYRQLEPAAPNALGELWAPADETTGATWPPGRYVIELATPSGSWVRWLGLELRETPIIGVTGTPAAGSPIVSPAP